MRIPRWVVFGLMSLAGAGASAQDIDPRGIFFNRFTGSFGGTEWFQTIPIAGTDRYRVADIFGGGFNCTITPDGTITLDGGVGTGSFSSADAYVIRPRLGGSVFTFTNTRAPVTDTDFPLQLESAIAGNPILAGVYRVFINSLNAETGAIESGGFENHTVTIVGDTIRVTDPDGLYLQGVFETPTRAGFRVVVPTPSDVRFRSFAGSALNFGDAFGISNMLGSLRPTSVNAFEGVFQLQSRTPLGSQTQNVITMEATRLDPLPAGDLDGDREIDTQDRALMLGQIGLVGDDDAFNIAADLDADFDVDGDDLARLNGLYCAADLAAPFGALNFFDISAFIGAFNAGDASADYAAPFGALNFFDVAEYIALFNAGCP